MGKTTDGLVKLANEITDQAQPPGNGYAAVHRGGGQVSIALLTMALHSLGQEGDFPDRGPGGHCD